ncbi:MAG: hypothetical protein ACRDKI_00365 [Solirubrobacterales bacterium]
MTDSYYVVRNRNNFLLAVVVALTVLAAIPVSSSAAESQRTTFLFSRSVNGGVPNGPSRNGTLTHDQRIARIAAYESDASNIVAGDSNGVTDVFFVRRATPWGNNGTPWIMSQTELASTGLAGQPANGPSYKPALDGSSHAKPSCIAFVSDASNLVPGDTNGVADAFVRNINSGKITRVSVNSDGKQANGPSFEVSLDGGCERVAFTSSATNLGLNNPKKLGWTSARTAGSTGGHRQVFVHVIKARGLDKTFNGMTFVASANDKGKPGNGDSYEPGFARAGKAVTYTSNASNLDRGDRNAQSDVYERTFIRFYTHVKGKGTQALKFDTRLVSANSGGKAGNGPSSHSTSTDDGRYISFETMASNVLPGDGNGVSDVARADMKKKRVKQDWVSKSIDGAGNGASNRPVISGAGEFVLFDSDANNLRPSTDVAIDGNGVRDMFLWNAPTRHVSLESRNWENGYLAKASENPASSSRGNYVLFESADKQIDELISNLTGISQLYMRYLGPQ